MNRAQQPVLLGIENVAIIASSGTMVDFYGISLSELMDHVGHTVFVWNGEGTKIIALFFNPSAVLDLDHEELGVKTVTPSDSEDTQE